jgi:very-short-patch-repair endonuclease
MADSRSLGAQRAPSELERHLQTMMRLHGLPEPVRELRFHPPRMFRLDFAWPDVKLAVEIEGGIYRGGGHTSVKGLMRDIEKSNLLTMDGWRLLRFHGDQVKSGEAVALIAQALAPAAGEREEG